MPEMIIVNEKDPETGEVFTVHKLVPSRDKNGWISVEEALPEDGENVLFGLLCSSNSERFVLCGSYSHPGDFALYQDHRFYGIKEDPHGVRVTHWQPLPPPPEEK